MTTYSKLDDVVVKNKSTDINRHVHVHHHNVQSMNIRLALLLIDNYFTNL